mgnify:CR=1 FL=1
MYLLIYLARGVSGVVIPREGVESIFYNVDSHDSPPRVIPREGVERTVARSCGGIVINVIPREGVESHRPLKFAVFDGVEAQ